jgi:peptide/nickel transport system permease protein
MADVALTPSTIARARPRRPNPVLHFIRKQPLGFIGFLIILAYFGLAIGAYWISPFHPEEIDFAAMLTAPSAEHPMGTDQYGRDVFSRLVYGARTAMAVGILSAFVGCTAGALIGATSGYFGGRIDNIIQRVVDIMLAFPIIVLAMVVVAVLGKRVVLGVDVNLIAAIALPMIPKMARIARSSTLSIAQMPFIDAARAAGYGHSRIVLRHITLAVFAFNLFGDSLRDWLDPKMKG